MSLKKRVLVIVPGLFLFFLFSLSAEENVSPYRGFGLSVSSGAGTLLVSDNGASGYGYGGIALDFFPRDSPENKFTLGIDLGRVSSSLSYMDFSAFAFAGKLGVQSPVFGINFASGIFNQSSFGAEGIRFNDDNISLSNDGGKGFFLGADARISIGPFDLSPSFFYGEAAWEKGGLYYFFGKPDLPALYLYGLTLRFDQANHELRGGRADTDGFAHELDFRFLRGELGIISNENRELFDAGLDAGFLRYQISSGRSTFDFSGGAGWAFAGLAIDGELTAANQHYFLFPYLFYRAGGELSLHAGFADLGFTFNKGIFRCVFTAGALYVFKSEGRIDTRYKKKNLFGGEEDSEVFRPDLRGAGIAFLFFEAGIDELSFGKKNNKRLSLALRKAFVFPWGYGEIFSSGSGPGTSSFSGSEVMSMIKTALLSGLSFSASFSW